MYPVVSVIMSVNSMRYLLEETIFSILNQSFSNIDFIIVNDGADNDVRKLIETVKDSRLIVLNQIWQGLTKSLNDAIKISRGKYIARIDADDYSFPDRLEKQLSFFDEYPKVGLLGTAFIEETTDGEYIGKVVFSTDRTKLKHQLQYQNQFCHGSVMFRKECLDNVGTYRNEFLKAQDYDLWLRIADMYEIANLAEVLYKRRVDKNSISLASRYDQELFAKIARECAEARRKDLIEPLDKLQKINTTLQKNRINNNRKKKAHYYFHTGRQLLKSRQLTNSRKYFYKSIIAWPFYLHQWFFIFATLFPVRIINLIEQIWKKIQRLLKINI